MKIEAKARLHADFEQTLLTNLASMPASGLRSLNEALESVCNWFYGRAMHTDSTEEIRVESGVGVPLSASVNLNLAANGMNWLTKVFGLQIPKGPYYRIHDMSFVVKKPPELLRKELPEGTSLEITNSKPLISFTSDLGAVKKFSKNNGGKKKPTDAYLKIEPSSSITPVFFNGGIGSSTIALAKSAQKKAVNLRGNANKELIKSVTTNIVNALMVADSFKNQKEVVCVLSGRRFEATIVGYAKNL